LDGVKFCAYCNKDLSKWNLNEDCIIICDSCVLRLTGTAVEIPPQRTERRSKRVLLMHEGVGKDRCVLCGKYYEMWEMTIKDDGIWGLLVCDPCLT